jgi:hypothetical protein
VIEDLPVVLALSVPRHAGRERALHGTKAETLMQIKATRRRGAHRSWRAARLRIDRIIAAMPGEPRTIERELLPCTRSGSTAIRPVYRPKCG